MEKIKKMTNDPQLLKYEVRKRKKDLIFWGISIIIVLAIFLFICSKEVYVLQTLSSIIKTLSFIIVLIKVLNFESCSGVSVNSLICFFLSFFCRNFVVVFFNIRLRNFKIDVINSTFNTISEFVSFFIICILLYVVYFKYPVTSDITLDNKMPFYYLVMPAFLLAIPFKPWIYRYWFIDLIWIFSIFLESISIYPQIILFTTKKGHIEHFTSHFLSLQAISSIFELIYWIKTYLRFNDKKSLLLGEYSGYLIMISEVVKLVILAYYLLLYSKSLINTRNHKKYDI
jgi:hypothetical protein